MKQTLVLLTWHFMKLGGFFRKQTLVLSHLALYENGSIFYEIGRFFYEIARVIHETNISSLSLGTS